MSRLMSLSFVRTLLVCVDALQRFGYLIVSFTATGAAGGGMNNTLNSFNAYRPQLSVTLQMILAIVGTATAGAV